MGPKAKALAVCSERETASRYDVLAEIDAAPVPLPGADLAALRTPAGIGLGVPLATALDAYGPATPAELPDGRSLYAWVARDPDGTTATVRVFALNGSIVGFGRETTYPTALPPELVPVPKPSPSASPAKN